MSEPSAAPSSGELQDSEAVGAVLAGYERFFAAQQSRFVGLGQVLQAAIEGHNVALEHLHEALRSPDGNYWSPVEAYISTVRECAVLPLRGALATLDLVEGSTRDWTEQTAGAGTLWSGLSRKDHQQLSPLLPFWKSSAVVLAAIEYGVSEWTRMTLDAAIPLDCGAPAVGTEISESSEVDAAGDDAVPESTFDPAICDAAGAQLVEQLTTAHAGLESLIESVSQPLVKVAEGRRKKLEAASAKDDAVADGQDTGSELDDQAPNWQSWVEQVNARIALAAARLAAFTALAQMQVAFIDRLRREGTGLWAAAAAAATRSLQELKAQAEQLYQALRESSDGRQAIRQATDLSRQAISLLDKQYIAATDVGETTRFVEKLTDLTLSDIRRQAQELPDTLVVHSLPESSKAAINPRSVAREVTLRPAASDAIDTILVPAFAAATELLGASIAGLSDEAANLRSVLRFHLGAATEELRDAYWTRSTPEVRRQADEAARELSLAGLERVIEALPQQQKRVDECHAAVSSLLTAARSDMWQTIGSQVQAETATQKLTLKTRSTLASSLMNFKSRAGEVSGELLQLSMRRLRQAGGRLRGAFHYGRKAVTGVTEPVDRQASIDAVSSLSEIRARLPVVYRRLFSFYPLSDETLLSGRDNDLNWLRKQLSLWRRGRASAYVLCSTPGSGLTSFLNVARQTCLRGTTVTEVDITQRVMEERQLTSLLADALRLEIASDKAPETLQALADLIMSTDVTADMHVCIVERLEHLYLRQIGGTDLFGRVLRFFSETDSRIFWISTVSDFAWQLLEKSEPLALGLIHHRKMSAYDRQTVEEVIIKRHRRSGLPLVFDPPQVTSPFFRRRLKNATSEEARQALLQEQYFDDLFNASGQNIMLALFYWHLSITYQSEPPAIQVHALPRLNFEFFAFLSLQEAFALKAFLEHATLTVSEYSQVADISAEASQEIFESLGNAMIVELDANEFRNVTNVEFERIEPQRRYRVRPLLVQPVIRYLRTKNIVH